MVRLHELRVGNILYSGNRRITIDVYDLVRIHQGGEYYGIPLSDADIQAFGFKPISKSKDYTFHRVFLHHRKRGWVINKRSPIIQTIHQLQNYVYATAGVELTYNNENSID